MSDSPFVVVWVFLGMLGFTCLLMFYITCCKMCKESREPQPEEPTRRTWNQPIPPPPNAPPVPAAPPLILSSSPPPYSEVVGKPYFYPVPVGQPPCYDNIAMEDLSPLERSQPPGSTLKDNF